MNRSGSRNWKFRATVHSCLLVSPVCQDQLESESARHLQSHFWLAFDISVIQEKRGKNTSFPERSPMSKVHQGEAWTQWCVLPKNLSTNSSASCIRGDSTKREHRAESHEDGIWFGWETPRSPLSLTLHPTLSTEHPWGSMLEWPQLNICGLVFEILCPSVHLCWALWPQVLSPRPQTRRACHLSYYVWIVWYSKTVSDTS